MSNELSEEILSRLEIPDFGIFNDKGYVRSLLYFNKDLQKLGTCNSILQVKPLRTIESEFGYEPDEEVIGIVWNNRKDDIL